MATYAIGDIQGCYNELRRLLDRIGFDPARDRLWCVGDLVNRGPDSLAVLRWLGTLGERAVVVLGNHDLHLLAVAAGQARANRKDSLDAVLAAPDREELLHWLRHRTLLHHDQRKGFAMVHAGLAPQWDLAQAQACATEVEQALRDPDYPAFLAAMYGNQPARWHPELRGNERLRFITNCLTRLRYCEPDGTLRLDLKGPPGSQPSGVLPWFRIPGRASADTRIVFGHWSTLGFLASDNVWALDSGCLWGGRLTALRLRSKAPPRMIDLNCPGYARPG